MKTLEQDQRAAFTLLEIMVAMALFALVAAAIYSSWFAVMRGSQVGLASAAKVQRSRVAMQLIEEALCSTRSFDADGTNYYFVGLNGSAATLSFVSKLSASFPRSGKFGDFDVREVEFALEPGLDSGKQLVLRQRPILMDLDKDEQLHPVVIAKDVKSFKMEFWDSRPPKNQANNNVNNFGSENTIEWLNEWEETNRLPAMVKIVLQFKGDDFGQAPRENIKVVGLPSQAVGVSWQRGRSGQPGGSAGGVRLPGLTPPGGNPGGIKQQ